MREPHATPSRSLETVCPPPRRHTIALNIGTQKLISPHASPGGPGSLYIDHPRPALGRSAHPCHEIPPLRSSVLTRATAPYPAGHVTPAVPISLERLTRSAMPPRYAPMNLLLATTLLIGLLAGGPPVAVQVLALIQPSCTLVR